MSEGYPYLVDEDDHCETPIEAYKDLKPFLKKLCKKFSPSQIATLLGKKFYSIC